MITAEIPRLPADPSGTELAATLDECGCCVIEGGATADVMDEITADLAPYSQRSEYGDADFAGAGKRRTGLVLNRSPAYRRIPMHSSVMAAGNQVLAGSPSWILSSVGFFELFPGEPKQRLHRDVWKYGAEGIPHEVDLKGIWAITDFTAQNGATHVVDKRNSAIRPAGRLGWRMRCLLPFRRPPKQQEGGKGRATFDFLGFTFYWVRGRKGRWAMTCKTHSASLRRFIGSVYDWCRRHRRLPVAAQYEALNRRIQGHFNLLGVSGNFGSLSLVLEARIWRRLGVGNRRGRLDSRVFSTTAK